MAFRSVVCLLLLELGPCLVMDLYRCRCILLFCFDDKLEYCQALE